VVLALFALSVSKTVSVWNNVVIGLKNLMTNRASVFSLIHSLRIPSRIPPARLFALKFKLYHYPLPVGGAEQNAPGGENKPVRALGTPIP
jgi:hypothetical protein